VTVGRAQAAFHEFALDLRIRGDRWSSFSVWKLSVCSFFLQTTHITKISHLRYSIAQYLEVFPITLGMKIPQSCLYIQNLSILIWVKTSQDQPQFTMGSHAKSMGIPPNHLFFHRIFHDKIQLLGYLRLTKQRYHEFRQTIGELQYLRWSTNFRFWFWQPIS
jgi:hypothetical protein